MTDKEAFDMIAAHAVPGAPADLVARLRYRRLAQHGGPKEPNAGWNLNIPDSEMHRDAADEIERLREALLRATRGEHICLKCGLRQDGYDAAGHAAAYPAF